MDRFDQMDLILDHQVVQVVHLVWTNQIRFNLIHQIVLVEDHHQIQPMEEIHIHQQIHPALIIKTVLVSVHPNYVRN